MARVRDAGPRLASPQCRARRFAQGRMMKTQTKDTRPIGVLQTPSDLSEEDTRAIPDALNRIVADSFAPYVKTKNFH